MSLTNFVPEIWSTELNYSLKKSLVAMSVTNQDYEGDIQNQGDTVHITRPSAISTGDYTPGSDITIETPTSSQQELSIDQATYFAFEVDDVYRVQANVDLMDPYLQEANYAVQDGLDQYIMGQYTSAGADNVITKEALTSGNIYAKLVEAKKLLSQQSVPKSGRWAVLSPDEIALLEDNERFTHATAMGDQTLRSGFVGRAAGFDVFESNNTVTANDGTDDVRHLPFGHIGAITFAMQFSEIESQRRESRFADLVKGLVLYGSQVVKPEALGDLQATQ